jgi:hypothetical protein
MYRSDQSKSRASRRRPRLDRHVEMYLWRMVGMTYTVLIEPAPERFVRLLEELERQENRN